MSTCGVCRIYPKTDCERRAKEIENQSNPNFHVTEAVASSTGSNIATARTENITLGQNPRARHILNQL